MNELFFIALITNCLFICGLNYAFSCDVIPDGNIINKQVLWFVSYYSKKIMGEFWSKPIAGCIVCMASIWSLPIYIYFFGSDLTQHNIITYLIYIPCLAGLNRFIERWL